MSVQLEIAIMMLEGATVQEIEQRLWRCDLAELYDLYRNTHNLLFALTRKTIMLKGIWIPDNGEFAPVRTMESRYLVNTLAMIARVSTHGSLAVGVRIGLMQSRGLDPGRNWDLFADESPAVIFASLYFALPHLMAEALRRGIEDRVSDIHWRLLMKASELIEQLNPHMET